MINIINVLNDFADAMLEDSNARVMWFAVMIFGVASTVLAIAMWPLTILEALLDPIFVGWMTVRTIRYYKNKH